MVVVVVYVVIGVVCSVFICVGVEIIGIIGSGVIGRVGVDKFFGLVILLIVVFVWKENVIGSEFVGKVWFVVVCVWSKS